MSLRRSNTVAVLSITKTLINRQMFDLNNVLNQRGFCSRLVISTPETIPPEFSNCIRVSYSQPGGSFSKIRVLRNLWALIRALIPIVPGTIVISSSVLLPVALLFKIVWHAKIVFYSTETLAFNAPKWLLAYCCSGIINVEENRQEVLSARMGYKPYMVLYNMPFYRDFSLVKPCMRRHLVNAEMIRPDDKLVVFAGSNQRYSQLGKLVEWSQNFPDNWKLVLIGYGFEGCWDPAKYKRLIVLPVVNGHEFYNWYVDADIALLPYEDPGDVNVRFCSPQKLFDCIALGVPVLGSDRPLIRKIIGEIGIGGLVDYTDRDAVMDGIKEILQKVSLEDRARIRTFHKKYCYDQFADKIATFIRDLA